MRQQKISELQFLHVATKTCNDSNICKSVITKIALLEK